MGYPEEGVDEEEDSEEEEPPPHPIKLAGVYNEEPSEAEHFVGFNGRCNKKADTCYAFWVTASLDVR